MTITTSIIIMKIAYHISPNYANKLAKLNSGIGINYEELMVKRNAPHWIQALTKTDI